MSGCLIDQIGGAFSKLPEDLECNASKTTRDLIDRAYKGINPGRFVDHHVHLLALGTSVKDAFVNPKMQSGLNLERLKFRIYVSASGVKNLDNADEEDAARLVRLARASAASRQVPSPCLR